jgi:hypothetical protein
VSILVAFAVCSAAAADRAPGQAITDNRPRLLVVIVVDQMRTDYVERYGRSWTGGLHRIGTEGVWFTEAAYPYLNTVTCAGHATIGTGRFPRSHGMVLNGWLDRALGTTVPCTSAPDESIVSVNGTVARGESAEYLRGPTFAEKVKAAGGRVVTISLKPRSAIALAGHASDATIWFGGSGTFVTSTAYAKELPAFVSSTLAAEPIARARTVPWVKLLPNDHYRGADDAIGERAPTGWSAVFPHVLDQDRFISLWQYSPAADAYLARLATAAIDAYKLGRGPRVDFLGVSFSTLDNVGHYFGPESHEVQDILAHLDRTIGLLLSTLDERVGRGRYVVALTSDHGVAPIPEQMLEAGHSSGRVDAKALTAAVDAALVPHLGKGPHAAGVIYTDFYLLPGVWPRLRANRDAIAAVKAAMLKVPGVARVFTRDELRRVDDRDPEQRAAALSWFEGRSGELIIIPRQYWITSSAPTTHGTLHAYDQRVPLIFFGAGITAGQRKDATTPADIAPTLAEIAGIRLKDTDGRALTLGAGAARPRPE